MSHNPRATLAGNSVRMIRPHLDDIPQVHFPDGYSIRPLRVEAGVRARAESADAARSSPRLDRRDVRD